MAFSDISLSKPRPDRVSTVILPRHESYYPSPADWRDEIIYFLLPDRFSNGNEKPENLLDVSSIPSNRPADFAWNKWSDSGAHYYQGGTLKGVQSKLDYIASLGASTLWIGPVLKNRSGRNDYHGYATQDYLDVDPRLGTRKDLVELVSAAHAKKMRVLLDVVVNHTGDNWNYKDQDEKDPDPGYRDWPGYYDRGKWRDRQEKLADMINGAEDGV